MIDEKNPCTQEQFGLLVGVSQEAVSDMLRRGVIERGAPVGDWLKSYCAHLREQAAGRSGVGLLNLADERAALAREQRIRIEMQNAVTQREYGPIAAMEQGLADAMIRVASQLDTIPGKLKMSSDKLTSADLNLVSAIIAGVRNDIADLNIDWFGDDGCDNDES